MEPYFDWPLRETKPCAFALQVGQVKVNGAQVPSKQGARITYNEKSIECRWSVEDL